MFYGKAIAVSYAQLIINLASSNIFAAVFFYQDGGYHIIMVFVDDVHSFKVRVLINAFTGCG